MARAAITHDGEVNHVVADKGCFGGFQVLLLEDFFEAGEFVLDALVNVFEFQIPGAQGHRLGKAFRDEAGLDPSQPRQRKRCAVVRVKSLGLNHALAQQTETTLVLVLAGMFLGRLLRARSAGKIQILPSVRTPSTSNRINLIFWARALDMAGILAPQPSVFSR
jgi:hypothetical protein